MVDPNKLIQISHEHSKYKRMEIIKEIINDWRVYGADMEQLDLYRDTLKDIKQITKAKDIKHYTHELLENKVKRVYKLSRDVLAKEPVIEMIVRKGEYEFRDNVEYKLQDPKTYKKLLIELDTIIEFAALDEEHIAILRNYFYDILILGKEEVKTYAR